MCAHGPRKTACGAGGLDRTAKLAYFMVMGYLYFAGEFRPASRRYPLQGATRTRAIGCCKEDEILAINLVENIAEIQ
jgi:hypothetical protein